jgi:Zn-dependent protease with chaperone function
MSVQTFQWQSRLALAKNALISGDYPTAEEYLNEAMTSSHDENAPEDAVADIFYHRGICFENKDRFVDARRAFNQAQHTFARCLGATSSQALKAGKAKCLVDIKMGRTAEAQREFAEIIELLKSDPGDFAAEITMMETEMRDMLSHPEPPDIPGTEVEIEPYAESWTPVRRNPEASTAAGAQSSSSQNTSAQTPFSQATSSHNPSLGSTPPPSAAASTNRKLNIPAEVSDAIAHLSRSGQMQAVPESYVTGGVTGRLTVDPSQLIPPILPGSPDEHDRDSAARTEDEQKAEDEEEQSRLATEELARQVEQEERARLAIEEESRKAEEEEIRAAAELAIRMAEEEEARLIEEEKKARVAEEEAEAKARLEAEEAARIAEEEAAHKAELEEKARLAADEAAHKSELEEKARLAAAEAARKIEKEEKARLVAAEATRKVEQEEKARLAAAEATRKVEQEEKARLAAAEAARKVEQEEKTRLVAEKAAEEEKARPSEEAARKSEQEKKLSTETVQKSEEELRLAAEEAATKADEQARKAAAAARKAAEEEARIASAEAARKAREGKARVHFDAEEQEKKQSAVFVDYEFDNSLSLTASPAPSNLSADFEDSWVLPPASVPPGSVPPASASTPSASTKAADLPPAEEKTYQPTSLENTAQTSEPDVKVRIVRSQPEAFTSKRPDGTMIDLAAIQPPKAPLVPPEPNLSIVTAQQPYPAEAERRKEPPLKPESQPERRASILAQVADELTEQLAGKIESQSVEKSAADVASSLAAEVSEVAHATEHLASVADKTSDLQARAHAAKLASEKSNFQTPVFQEKPTTAAQPTIAATAKTAATTPPAPPPSTSASQAAIAAAAAAPATEKSTSAGQALNSAPLHTNTILDMPARNFNKTMMDIGAAGAYEQGGFAANAPLANSSATINSPGKSVDVAKLSEFQQRLSESAMVNAPSSASPTFLPHSSADPTPLTERSNSLLPEQDEVGEDKFDKNKASAFSRAGRTPTPVSQQKSLITPRHFIRPLNIPELTTAGERTYTKAVNIAAVVIYGLSILFGVGIVLMPVIMIISHVLDGISLGRMRGNGIKITPEQFPEVFEAVHNLAASLGMPTAPEAYVINKHGVLNACAKRYHQRDYVIVYTDVLELAYSFGESELAFVISHELAHIQCGHLKRKWIDFPAKLIPFLGQALSRAREYTCDRIAQELVPEGASMGLVALSVGTKLFRRINLKALYAQQDSVEDFWSWFSEVISSKPHLNSRIRALAPGEDRNKPSKASAIAPIKKR